MLKETVSTWGLCSQSVSNLHQPRQSLCVDVAMPRCRPLFFRDWKTKRGLLPRITWTAEINDHSQAGVDTKSVPTPWHGTLCLLMFSYLIFISVLPDTEPTVMSSMANCNPFCLSLHKQRLQQVSHSRKGNLRTTSLFPSFLPTRGLELSYQEN